MEHAECDAVRSKQLYGISRRQKELWFCLSDLQNQL